MAVGRRPRFLATQISPRRPLSIPTAWFWETHTMAAGLSSSSHWPFLAVWERPHKTGKPGCVGHWGHVGCRQPPHHICT